MEADADARRAIESRIFIAAQVYDENVLEQYWNSLHAALIAAAHHDLDIKEHIALWRRWFRRTD